MKKSGRLRELESCLVIATGLMVAYVLTKHEMLLWTAIAVGAIGALLPTLAYWIDRAWYGIAHLLGTVMSFILLTLVYVIVLLPTALLKRIFSSDDQLNLKQPDSEKDSLWKLRDYTFGARDLKNPW